MALRTETLLERVLAKLTSEGKVHIFTEEENIQTIQELNEGTDDFLRDEHIRQVESRLELKETFLTS